MEPETAALLSAVTDGHVPTPAQARALAAETELQPLRETAAALRDAGHRNVISYSRKVFIPLTQLCRDVCHYCTFARPPRRGERAYLTLDEVLEVARAGAAAGCREALFTLGDKPERRYEVARRELAAHGHATTISYLVEVAGLVLKETGLLPHANPGVMRRDEISALRSVSASQGIMLESSSERLGRRGAVHFGSPDKRPEARLETMRLAGELQVPFTSGILIGIGETRLERIDALLALRALHERYGHIQEIIVQNFRAKADTKMAQAPEPDLDDLLWTIAVARIVLGPQMNIQAPPNLSPGRLIEIIGAGINDWGGVSPVTPDHVNPEAPWPHLAELEAQTTAAGKVLTQRLAVYPEFALDPARWQDPTLAPSVYRAVDTDGFARVDPWSPGDPLVEPSLDLVATRRSDSPAQTTATVDRMLTAALAGGSLGEEEIVRLFQARGPDYATVCAAADELRQRVNGDVVTYVVNRNINYTNVCYFRCQFCAFSKGKLSENLRGAPYDLDAAELARRVREAWERGATEVCMQGGINPDYTGQTYVELCREVKRAAPEMHVHAFSPLEIWQGAATAGVELREFLLRLREAGLGTLPGTAAEILDDEVRAILCPDKINTSEWLRVMEEAHAVGFRTTATIMFGHMEGPRSWARHLLRLKELQARTGGFTEFVPLPFVHMEAPIYLKGRARKGPTFRETVLMHAVGRLALHPEFPSVQASWVKLGPTGSATCLRAGANDLGGTLMNESISRAAGAAHGQEMPPAEMEGLIRSIDRVPLQRSTLYGSVPEERRLASLAAPALAPVVQTPTRRYDRPGGQPVQLVRPAAPAGRAPDRV